ncbi:hypothetical protein KZ829_35685 [Actinoplanes hulinensis]|uniref:Uncharacterized protein n=1 Tax=Actinoplanes hulinensis TaxID=1144547 RepID=A0ABS7BDN3_9ACTN|nr:hypothetical protein [Actinoplanes hulinensis]MBW6439085.1 hypothetical protein [Actinoplanes hulinensis]
MHEHGERHTRDGLATPTIADGGPLAGVSAEELAGPIQGIVDGLMP